MANSPSSQSSHTSNLPLNQNPTSIYYIHPSDANSAQLVSFKFNGEGFTSWKRSMLLTLSAKNKAGFVDGTFVKPGDEYSAEYKAWERCNDLVCSWLLFNLDESIASSVMFLRSAKDVWSDLEERFGYTSLAQIYSLEQKLADINQGNQTVSEFFTSIKSIWDAIDEAHPLPYCTCNHCTCNLTKKIFERHQERMVIQFMMKLNDKFSTIRGNMLMMPSLPKATEAYRMFAQEEKHREISQFSCNTESLAFLAEKRKFPTAGDHRPPFKPNFSGNTYKGNRGRSSESYKHHTPSHGRSLIPGHELRLDKYKLDKPGSKYYCTHCRIPGHSIDRCYEVHGYPPGFKGSIDRRVVAMTHGHVDTPPVSEASSMPSLTPEQYQQFMQYLHTQKVPDHASEVNMHESHQGSAMMAERSLDASW
ncbi:unnamed protein product [Amaranthus hypochondriacus]